MPWRCASRRAADRDRLAGEQDLAAVRLVDAGHDLDQRRLAGAVLAEEGVDLARLEMHIEFSAFTRPKDFEILASSRSDGHALLPIFAERIAANRPDEADALGSCATWQRT